MEKFSRKETVALVIFGIILLAIIAQMVWRLGEFGSSPQSDMVENVKLNRANDLLRGSGVKLSASSRNQNSEIVDKLVDNAPHTFWHVNQDRVGEPAWVTVDFGAGGEKTIRSLGALPRKKLLRQFFRTAELLGSDNGEDWETISSIVQDAPPKAATWREWKFENDRAFRYYKLLITTGYESGKFYSMAELSLFE
jgi:F5/8 type C domain-containing protein